MTQSPHSSKGIRVAVAALAMCLAGGAFAQDGRFDRDHRDDRGFRHEQRDQRNGRFDDRRDGGDYRPGRQFDRPGYPQPHAEWHRGDRVPPQYRGGNYIVNDWRGHRLQAPPRGYQWVGVGGDYVLAAIATGLIAQIIVGQ